MQVSKCKLKRLGYTHSSARCFCAVKKAGKPATVQMVKSKYCTREYEKEAYRDAEEHDRYIRARRGMSRPPRRGRGRRRRR